MEAEQETPPECMPKSEETAPTAELPGHLLYVEWHQLELKYSHLRVEDPNRLSRLMTSLAQNEQQSPAWVVESCPGHYVLIDGYLRAEALRRLGRDGLIAVNLAMNETEALLSGHASSRGPPRSALEEAWLLFELTEVHKVEQQQLATRFEKSRSWVSRRLALLTVLPTNAQEAVRKGVVSAKAAEKYLVPLARANWKHCEQLVSNLGTRRTSVREMARLYLGYRQGGREEREELVKHPLLYLKVDEERQKSDSEILPESAAETIVSDLEAAAGCSRRARKRLQEQQRQGEDMSMNEAVTRAYSELMSAIEALTSKWEELPGAGP